MLTNDGPEERALLFQYCPKLAVLDKLGTRVLLCRRKGEEDYDGVYSLIGGKMEHKDSDIRDALEREKNEEVGGGFQVKVLLTYSVDVHFSKRNGSRMILPHFYAQHIGGEISLNDEYDDATWVLLTDLPNFEPKIANISWIVPALAKVSGLALEADYNVI